MLRKLNKKAVFDSAENIAAQNAGVAITVIKIQG